MGRLLSTTQLPRQTGFTLLEVLVAFVLMAVAVVVISQSFAGGLRNLARTDSYGIAALIADSQLAQVGIVYPIEPVEIDQAEVEEDSEIGLEKKYHWSISIAPYDLALDEDTLEVPARYQLFQVSVKVGWKEGGDSKTLQISSLRLGPLEGTF